jgi:predicted DNA-binding transcriptional regulator AlpA
MPPDGPTTLYRFFDAAGALLYVGITCKPYLRFATHRSYTDWWELAASCKLERFPTRATALEAEKDAIATEHPIHNRAGNPSRVTRIPQRSVTVWPVQVAQEFDPVGAQEIAERAGVQRDTVWKWRRRYPDFPAPVTLNMGPVWDWPDVARWLGQRAEDAAREAEAERWRKVIRDLGVMIEKGGAA